MKNSVFVDKLPDGCILDAEAPPIFCDPNDGMARYKTIPLDLFEETLSLLTLGGFCGEA